MKTWKPVKGQLRLLLGACLIFVCGLAVGALFFYKETGTLSLPQINQPAVSNSTGVRLSPNDQTSTSQTAMEQTPPTQSPDTTPKVASAAATSSERNQEPPADARRETESRYGNLLSLREGMTYSQVEHLLGTSGEVIGTMKIGEMQKVTYGWPLDEQHYLSASFSGDKLEEWGIVEIPQAMPPPPIESELPDDGLPTLEKFNAIRRGMTVQEVDQILGSEGALTYSSFNTREYEWSRDSPPGSITVTFGPGYIGNEVQYLVDTKSQYGLK